MRILVIGATGLLGTPVARALEANHEVLGASLKGSALQVDFADPESIRNLYGKVGQVDAVVSVAGQAVFQPLVRSLRRRLRAWPQEQTDGSDQPSALWN